MTSFILTLRKPLVAKLVISGILSSIFFILALYIYIYIYIYILTTSFFTTSISLLKSTGTGANLSTSYLFGSGKYSLIHTMSCLIYTAVKRITESFPFNI